VAVENREAQCESREEKVEGLYCEEGAEDGDQSRRNYPNSYRKLLDWRGGYELVYAAVASQGATKEAKLKRSFVELSLVAFLCGGVKAAGLTPSIAKVYKREAPKIRWLWLRIIIII
jgi:hypothetical protein